MRAAVERTNRPEVVGGLGGFAGLFALDTAKYRRPLLASSTDGVGTKIALARQLDRHDTVGIDLVAMVVDDLVACGAEPLFLQDYVACGKVVPERIAAIVTGIAEGCTQAGAALVGGETAEHGDLMDADEYDLAATAVGVVEADARPGARAGAPTATSSSRWRPPGSTPTATRWSAGWSSAAGLDLHATPAGLDRPLGRGAPRAHPHLRPRLPGAGRGARRGGRARLRAHHRRRAGRQHRPRRARGPRGGARPRRTWALPAAVRLMEEHGVPREESERAFNCGVGMIAAVAPDVADAAVAQLTARRRPVVGRRRDRAPPVAPARDRRRLP